MIPTTAKEDKLAIARRIAQEVFTHKIGATSISPTPHTGFSSLSKNSSAKINAPTSVSSSSASTARDGRKFRKEPQKQDVDESKRIAAMRARRLEQYRRVYQLMNNSANKEIYSAEKEKELVTKRNMEILMRELKQMEQNDEINLNVLLRMIESHLKVMELSSKRISLLFC